MKSIPNADVDLLRKRIFELLDSEPNDPSPELLELLEQYWQRLEVDFGSKMEPWKADRIYEVKWIPPILEFWIERHPGLWDRIQRWEYNFTSNEVTLLKEWGVRKNPNYTRKQVHKDAKTIFNAMLHGKPHSCVEKKGGLYWVWVGRLPQTKPVSYQLPQRTARGRQARLKTEVAKLMETQTEFERVLEQESTGSLVYKHQD